MKFRILGPLEVEDGGRAIELGGARARALMAILLLRRNEVVPVERLLEDLYGSEQPATGAKSLQVHISRLRKALGAGVLKTRGAGYGIETGADDVDADRFARQLAAGRSALAAGDAAAAESSLMGALALWRGPPLSDVSYHDFAQGEISRLEDLRLACIEELCETHLVLGRHGETIGQLEQLVAEHPLRERFRSQLMLALYRAGRQAEALEVYQTSRRALVEELGIEPGRRLQELQQSILRQDAGLELAGATSRESPPGEFVGRENELTELVAGLDDAFAGRGRIFLLAGEPGIGKSRLAEALVAHAGARGAQVLVGRSWEAGGAPAYWPWVQSLRAYAREADPSTLLGQLGVFGADLSPLLPELRELFPHLPEPAALESEGARFRLFEAVAAVLKNIAQDQPVVLVLDDLHAADASSLLLLQFVAREIRHSRLLVVGMFRDVDPTMRDPLVSALAELAREPHVRRIDLTGLTVRDVADYIELSAKTAPTPEIVAAIHAETEGNPLFVGEVVRLLSAQHRLDEPESQIHIPPGVRAVIGQRVRRLSERCQSVLVAAAIFGREFRLGALARLSELPLDEVLEILDEAMAERVIVEAPGSPGRLRFGHALIRDTLYDDLTLARKLEWHRRAGEALEAVYVSDPEPHLAELALHFFSAAPTGGAAKAVDYARRAGNRAVSQLAYEEAMRLYEMALTQVSDDATRGDLLLALGDARARAGNTAASKAAFRAAAELAEARGSPQQLARAALGYGSRLSWDVSRDDTYLAPLLERALDTLGDQDSALRVRLLARLAGGPLRDASVSPARKEALSEEALGLARGTGDAATIAYALAGYIAAHHSPEHAHEQVRLAGELIQAATEAGDVERALEGHMHRAEALLELGEIEAAKADGEAMARLAKDLRQPSQDWMVAELRAQHALLEGRFADAERFMAEALSLGERAESWNATVSYRLQLYMLRRHQGRLDETEEVVRRSVDDYPTYPIWRCVLAHMAAELGYQDESREAFEALALDRFAIVPFNEMWLASMGLLAETARSLGDAQQAAVLRGHLLPYADRVAVSTPEFSMGSVSYHLALLAATIGRWSETQRHFEDAIAMNSRVGARPWLAHTQEEYARELIARGGPDDVEMAEHRLQQALAIYRELGMVSYVARASALAEEVDTAA